MTILERCRAFLETPREGPAGPLTAEQLAEFIRSVPQQCECLGGSTYNDGVQRRCDLCGFTVLNAAHPPVMAGREEIATALAHEEKYLLESFDAECGIMPGDVQGSFHRIRAALSPSPAQLQSGVQTDGDQCKNCTPENCAYIKGGYGRCSPPLSSADRGRE